jgi:hypothetical protein
VALTGKRLGQKMVATQGGADVATACLQTALFERWSSGWLTCHSFADAGAIEVLAADRSGKQQKRLTSS